jgi:hypothetical protein
MYDIVGRPYLDDWSSPDGCNAAAATSLFFFFFRPCRLVPSSYFKSGVTPQLRYPLFDVRA